MAAPQLALFTECEDTPTRPDVALVRLLAGKRPVWGRDDFDIARMLLFFVGGIILGLNAVNQDDDSQRADRAAM